MHVVKRPVCDIKPLYYLTGVGFEQSKDFISFQGHEAKIFWVFLSGWVGYCIVKHITFFSNFCLRAVCKYRWQGLVVKGTIWIAEDI